MFALICSILAFIFAVVSIILTMQSTMWFNKFNKLKENVENAKTPEEREKARKEIDKFIEKYYKET